MALRFGWVAAKGTGWRGCNAPFMEHSISWECSSEPLNEAADALAAAAAADSDPGRPVAMDLDPEAVHFMYRETLVEWDA
jgi:hypothetical protein